jgi:hypothetical protein
VYICHAPPDNPTNTKTLSVSVNAVLEHLSDHPGDKLGKCGEDPCQQQLITRSSGSIMNEELITGMQVRAYPNPASSQFTLQVRSDKTNAIEIRVRDLQGRTIYSKRGQQGEYRFGENFARGLYIVEVTQGERKEILKITKQ